MADRTSFVLTISDAPVFETPTEPPNIIESRATIVVEIISNKSGNGIQSVVILPLS
jgi:hypothetical protein